MARSFEYKKREKKHILGRRSRLRKAYFKKSGSEHFPETASAADLSSDDGSDSGQTPTVVKDKARIEEKSTDSPEDKLTKKQKAQRKRREQYRKFKEAQERREAAEAKRQLKHKKATARTKKGQPKLGEQMGLLLEKIRESQ